MKSLEEIIKQEPVFMNDWSSRIGVIGDFEGVYMTDEEYEELVYPNDTYRLNEKESMTRALEKYKDVNILFASYGNANYSGEAWVLFEQDGKLYEVNGGHCSCYGLEDQWSPEDVMLEELEHRLVNGTFGEDSYADNYFKERLCEFLGVEYKENEE